MNRKIFLILFLACSICLSNTAAAEDDVASQPSNKPGAVDNTSLSDFISKDNTEAQNTEADKDEKKEEQENSSWLGAGLDMVTKKITPEKPKEVVPVKRSNASVFDIAGIMLHMNRQQVEDAMQKRGYRQVSEDLKIPNFIRWRYEEICRNKDVIGYERLTNCVVKLSKQNNYQYVERVLYNNFTTKETISVRFTSNFTGNKVYFIEYRTEAANIKGSGSKATYLRNLKIYDFWKQDRDQS